MHSEISFKVKHLVITTVTGKFKHFSGKVVSGGDDFADAQIEFTADVNSIDTGAEARDGHLKGADFFDAAMWQQHKDRLLAGHFHDVFAYPQHIRFIHRYGAATTDHARRAA